ncbi:hypothetical protein M409DRAFT_27281 [Zasmidium cellare ATCC 36951]|uniref:Uncharacterized protein n=1 Tax=Zasmidium cellare ATCC 36951 TaxID=1080233 RepID=A0A6A6C7Q2_ZASCE|nr:uncharacterized protein M409DRAFT_27281 [Zasmidium cellare ATCC 36951]KAF2162278.1 hypothetical protein M409DRAFT_27281 [Zasmidium cellare ATCC 36951]
MKLLLLVSLLVPASYATTFPTCTKPDVETFGSEPNNPLVQQGNKAPVINGIDFTEWVLGRTAPILTPASPPNLIGVSFIGNLLSGNPTVYPRASFYAVDAVKSFTLSSLRYGCFITSAVGSGLAATPCTVSVSGYTPDGKQTSEETFSYTPGTLQSPPMGSKVFEGLRGLVNVTFEVVGAGIVPVPIVVFALDDVAVCRYYK